MHVLSLRLVKLGAIALLALAVMAAAYAFAASNTVPGTRAGDGAGTISGYTVTNVKYTLDGTNPQQLSKVEFDLDAAATTVMVRLKSSGGSWYSCSNTSSNHWQCAITTPGQDVASADELRVVAVQ